MTETLASMVAAARGAVREVAPAEAREDAGARSLLAAQTLQSTGFERVEVLGGGLAAWDEAGLPVERDQEPAA